MSWGFLSGLSKRLGQGEHRPAQPLSKNESRYQRGGETGRRAAGFRAGLEAKVIWGFSRNSKRMNWTHEGPRRERE